MRDGQARYCKLFLQPMLNKMAVRNMKSALEVSAHTISARRVSRDVGMCAFGKSRLLESEVQTTWKLENK